MSAFTCFYNQYCVLQMLFFLLASCQIFRGRFVANFQTTHHACRVRGHFVGQEDFGIFMFRWDWKRKVRGDELLRFEAARGSARTLNTSERERFWMNLVFPVVRRALFFKFPNIWARKCHPLLRPPCVHSRQLKSRSWTDREGFDLAIYSCLFTKYNWRLFSNEWSLLQVTQFDRPVAFIRRLQVWVDTIAKAGAFKRDFTYCFKPE